MPGTFTDQRLVPGVQPTQNKVRHPLRGVWASVQHCHAWLFSAIQAACQPGTSRSFPCSSTITHNSHHHRKKVAGTQTRTSIQSPTSLSTILKSLKLSPFLIPNPLPQPLRRCSECSGWGQRLAEAGRYKPIQITASTQREQTEAVKVTLTLLCPICSLCNTNIIFFSCHLLYFLSFCKEGKMLESLYLAAQGHLNPFSRVTRQTSTFSAEEVRQPQ